MWNERQKRIILNTKQKPQLHLFPYPLSGANNTCIVVIIKRNPRKYKNFYNIRRLDWDLQKFFSKNNLSQKCLNVTEVGLWINIFFTSSKEVDIFLKASRRQIHVDIDLWGSRWRTLTLRDCVQGAFCTLTSVFGLCFVSVHHSITVYTTLFCKINYFVVSTH